MTTLIPTLSAALSAAVVALVALVALGACGSGVSTSSRGAPPATAGDPALVQVIDGSPDGELRLVSLSRFVAHLGDDLPPTAPDAVVAAMRADAARHGATRLYLERVDSPLHKAFYGLGVVPSPGATTAPAPCDHAGFHDAVASSARNADRCVAALRVDRPALQGRITVVFQVDADGEVMRAAATPDSTRDGMAQLCALRAVHGSRFGEPAELTCAGALEITFGEEASR